MCVYIYIYICIYPPLGKLCPAASLGSWVGGRLAAFSRCPPAAFLPAPCLPDRPCLQARPRQRALTGMRERKFHYISNNSNNPHLLLIKGHPLLIKGHLLLVKGHLLIKGHPLTIKMKSPLSDARGARGSGPRQRRSQQVQPTQFVCPHPPGRGDAVAAPRHAPRRGRAQGGALPGPVPSCLRERERDRQISL